MNKMQRAKYHAMPLCQLRELHTELNKIITELEILPNKREIDIAAEHSNNPHLVAKIYRTVGDKSRGRWKQLESIFCSSDHCQQCPHGPYWYGYRRNKRHGTLTLKFAGRPAFHPDDIELLRQRTTIPAAYEIRLVRNDDKR